MKQRDPAATALVIGAGANELVCAHRLARTGRRVIVIAGRVANRAARAEPGWIPPRIVRELGLEQRGLVIERPDPWVSARVADGSRLELWQDMARSTEAIRRLSARDADKWPDFCARMQRLARLLEALYDAPPPDPTGRRLRELARLGALALRARGLGRQGIEDLLRLLPMPVADLLDDWFESDALKGVLGALGVMHLHQGPRASGTSFVLLHHHVGSPPGVFRPPVSNLASVLGALPGVEIRHGTEVSRIRVREARVCGATLANGEEIASPLVVSGAEPRHTLLEHVDPGWLDPEFARAVRNIRARGVTARVTLVLDRAPDFRTLAVAPSLDYLERAHDDAKYGRVSGAPSLEARYDGARSDGAHELDVQVQYAPYALADGEWNDARRAALAERVGEMLSPRLGAAVIGSEVRSPRDLEIELGWPQGQPYHAELALDQALWMRPIPALAQYRAPIAGLYLCGAGMHPGAGIAGASGWHCAGAILRDSRQGVI
jgi:phytoene dehydrogenase-like protein